MVTHEIGFAGHSNIRSLHTRTIEITRDRDLTPNGDCIIGVGADAGCMDIPSRMKKMIMDSSSRIKVEIIVDKMTFIVLGRGNANLTLEDPDDIVIRKSDFACPRTMAVRCDLASDSIPREMVHTLQDPSRRGTFRITVE